MAPPPPADTVAGLLPVTEPSPRFSRGWLDCADALGQTLVSRSDPRRGCDRKRGTLGSRQAERDCLYVRSRHLLVGPGQPERDREPDRQRQENVRRGRHLVAG